MTNARGLERSRSASERVRSVRRCLIQGDSHHHEDEAQQNEPLFAVTDKKVNTAAAQEEEEHRLANEAVQHDTRVLRGFSDGSSL